MSKSVAVYAGLSLRWHVKASWLVGWLLELA